jgi:uncharacterized protein YjbI with pentapeptide repeats
MLHEVTSAPVWTGLGGRAAGAGGWTEAGFLLCMALPGGIVWTMSVTDEILSETEHLDAVLKDCDFSDQAATRVTFTRCQLTRVSLARTRLQRLDLDRVAIEGCDAANAVWEASRLDKVRIKDCRLTGIGLARSSFKETAFHSCQLCPDLSVSLFR